MGLTDRASADADVIVVGAGPAGSVAAWALAEAGRSVILLDRRRFPRDKACGEGILPKGVAVLERMGLVPSLLAAGAQSFGGIRYHAPGGRTAVGAFPAGSRGLGVRRVVLDETLLAVARAHRNVRVEESFVVRDILRDARGAVTGVTDGERALRAPLTIGADGARSTVRRQAGLDGAPTARQAVRMHFRPAIAPARQDLVDVYVGGACESYVTPVAPGEYGVAFLADGAFPFDARVEATDEPAAERLIRAALAPRDGIASILASAPSISSPLAMTGIGRTATSPVADGLVLLGDAAGSPDPITGMGIAFAMRCASRIPAALAGAFAANDFSAARLAPYAKMRRGEVAGGFAVTHAVLWLASRDARAEWAIRALGIAPAAFTALYRLAA